MTAIALSQMAPPKQTRWQFIDASNNNTENLTQVKRHVMQEYMRQKRLDNQDREKTSGPPDKSEEEPARSTQKKQQRAKRTSQLRRRPSPSRSSARETPTTSLPSHGGIQETHDQKGTAKGKEKASSVSSEQPLPYVVDDDVEEIARHTWQDTTSSIPSSAAADLMLSWATSLPLSSAFHPTSPPLSYPPTYHGSQSDDGYYDQSNLDSSERPSDLEAVSSWVMSKPASPPYCWSPRPQSILSAARKDPFTSLPMALTARDHQLFDFYVHDMPACCYGTHFRSPKAHNWYTDVFAQEAMKGALSFANTILVHAANTWIWLRNEAETRDTLYYRSRAITMLKDHLIRYPRDVSDNAITACMSAAALEDFDPRPGHKEISWIHMRAARGMIRNRGGPKAFENTKLAMLINWQDYIMSGYETHGPSFYYEHSPSFSRLATDLFPESSLSTPPLSRTTPPLPSSSAAKGQAPFPLTPEQEIQLQCEEFISFLHRCEHLALCHRRTPYDQMAASRLTAFGDGAVLSRILSSHGAQRCLDTSNRKQLIARLAALMMINAALWDYRASTHRTVNFIQHLIRKVFDAEADTSGSVEALLQILLACQDGVEEIDDEEAKGGKDLPGPEFCLLALRVAPPTPSSSLPSSLSSPLPSSLPSSSLPSLSLPPSSLPSSLPPSLPSSLPSSVSPPLLSSVSPSLMPSLIPSLTPLVNLAEAPDYTQYSPDANSPFARPWFVGRMLKIAKRLSLHSWLNLTDFLWRCLTLQIDQPLVATWEVSLRREVLKAPLTSYVMPAWRS